MFKPSWPLILGFITNYIVSTLGYNAESKLIMNKRCAEDISYNSKTQKPTTLPMVVLRSIHSTPHQECVCTCGVVLDDMNDLTDDFRYMAIATFVAYRALKNGETPVACIFVHEPTLKILSYGCNDTNRSLNGTRHAEFIAIDRILEENDLLGKSQIEITDFFQNVTLYVTVEPCVMCALAIKQLGIGKVYFGAANDRFGGNGTVIKIQDDSYQSYGGIMRVEAVHLLRNFYIQENDTAPIPKIKKSKDIDGKEFPPNLNFCKYLTKEKFIETYGQERYEHFYEPNPHQEITPMLQKGYNIDDLLTVNELKSIPHIDELYPSQKIDLQRDIHSLKNILPRISDDGEVVLVAEEGRKRKQEEENGGMKKKPDESYEHNL